MRGKYVAVDEIAEIVTLTQVNYLTCDYDKTKYRWKAAC